MVPDDTVFGESLISVACCHSFCITAHFKRGVSGDNIPSDAWCERLRSQVDWLNQRDLYAMEFARAHSDLPQLWHHEALLQGPHGPQTHSSRETPKAMAPEAEAQAQAQASSELDQQRGDEKAVKVSHHGSLLSAVAEGKRE